jgi:AraC-like DNA-binding protein
MSDPERDHRPSDAPLPLLVVLAPHDTTRAKILHAMRETAELMFCATAAEAEQLVAGRRPSALLATNTDDADGEPARDVAARFHLEYPDLPIILLHAPESARARARKTIAPGIGRAAHIDRDLGRHVVAHIRRSAHRARRRVIGEALAKDLPVSAQDVVRRAIDQGDAPQSVLQLAGAIGVPRKTMDRRLSKAIPLTARQLIAWGRLLAAAMQLEESTDPVDCISNELEFSSPSALRNLLQRYAAVTPTELRQRGGSAYLLERLSEALRTKRPK